MSTPRLPFLWPMLYKRTRASPSRARIPSRKQSLTRTFTTTCNRAQETVHQRYGKAHEPAPHLKEQSQPKDTEKSSTSPEKQTTRAKEEEEEDEDEEPQQTTKAPASPPKAEELTDPTPLSPPPDPPKTAEQKPLDTVLHMPSPQEEQHKGPNLKTPPYVHHFDTYSLVKDLTKSGFSEEQSVSIMKAVRGILTANMGIAREGLVSKSNVENETYLFRAACSELRTEIGNARKGEMERMRTERNQLQHEVDILGQRMGQETSHLKDELKGLFDDRKMAVRQEQRAMETKIQEIGYKITVALNSDARSEVEGLRWVLTRRAAITVGVSAFMLFVALRYSSYVQHSQTEKKRQEEKKPPPPDNEQQPPPPGNTTNTINKEETIGGEILATEGGVSLG